MKLEQPEKDKDIPRPLTTDYKYGGVGNIDRKDLPIPNGWKKGR